MNEPSSDSTNAIQYRLVSCRRCDALLLAMTVGISPNSAKNTVTRMIGHSAAAGSCRVAVGPPGGWP